MDGCGWREERKEERTVKRKRREEREVGREEEKREKIQKTSIDILIGCFH